MSVCCFICFFFSFLFFLSLLFVVICLFVFCLLLFCLFGVPFSSLNAVLNRGILALLGMFYNTFT